MHYSISLFHFQHVDIFCTNFSDEILLHPSSLSKLGSLTESQVKYLAQFFFESGKRLTLVCDLLMTESKFTALDSYLERIPLKYFHAIRFLDPGVGLFIQKRFPQQALQIILEHNSHSLPAIKQWIKKFSPLLERVILSNEIPYNQIEKFRSEISVEIELLGIGRLEILYTPRHLLSHFSPLADVTTQVMAKNLERASSLTSPVIENNRGTFLFYERDLYIADRLPSNGVIDWMRIDFYESQHFTLFQTCNSQKNWQAHFKTLWPIKTTGGFFKVNKTDAQFHRLKNTNLESKNKKLGEIFEYKKGKHLIAKFYHGFSLPLSLNFFSPEGHKTKFLLTRAESISGTIHSQLIQPGMYRLPWIKHAFVKSRIEKDEVAEQETFETCSSE